MSSETVIGPLPRLLLAIVIALAAADATWLSAVHFAIDWRAYSLIALLAAALTGGGIFYTTLRKDERLSAILFGTAFLIVFSGLAAATNYFLLTVAGGRNR